MRYAVWMCDSDNSHETGNETGETSERGSSVVTVKNFGIIRTFSLV